MGRAILVTVDFGRKEGWTAEERSLELSELARSTGAKVVKEEIVRRHGPSPECFIGTGKAEEIAGLCAAERAGLVIFNNDLTGTQQKNLEEIIGVKTIDRTQLILDIFARHAHSNEGKVQVELAQLLYLLPRLTGKGVMFSRQGGGIGTSGPGEQKLEVDRRRIKTRVFKLTKDLEDLNKRRGMMRKNRARFSLLTIAIIGYTNVGKSTLLNALAKSDVTVQDKLFSTLDPTIRKFILPNKQAVLFVDTVGFLYDLPHHLIEAFKATLEEVVDADILLHLVDVSHPKAKEQAAAVYKVLEEIGAKGKTIISALNKIDKVEPAIVDRLKSQFDNAIPVSALNRIGFEKLIDRLLLYVKKFTTKIKLTIPIKDAKTLNMIYENGLVTKKEYKENDVYVEAEVPIRVAEGLK
ncbi:MAG: GTPase HflX [Candidatus Omnitrophota bacterium]|nr:GTPase HflX [Candidatus Omnitrophota bacterium]